MRPLLLVLLLAGCGDDPPRRPRADLGPVVAEVNGVAIHRAQLEARMRHDGLSPRAALDRLVDEELTIEAARRLGLRPDSEAGETRKRALVQALLAREVESKVGASDIGERDVAEAWESGRELEVDHLLVKRGDEAKARAFAQRVGEAARRTTTREDFIALATSMREDGLELITEDLGKFRRTGQFVAAFEDRVFRMTRAGEISEPFETEFGWHVVRVRGVSNAFGESLAEAHADVVEKLVTQRRRALYDALVKRLRGSARVEVDSTTLGILDAAP